MKGKGRGLPPNVISLRTSRPGPPSTAAILDGLELMRVVMRIETARDRRRFSIWQSNLRPTMRTQEDECA
jgi:hypothetical protein